ncbi:hypothetical protein [Bradyrhizobium lablabi]|uniref:hypothetical protein n=1 Tax=Bradyrhizobium lablabi TaxID=722472 RepID=UPI0012AB6F89|nr:hypothetical protein [Bradyrhizobium lablabi]
MRKSKNRQAAANLILQFRIERAAGRMGWIGLLLAVLLTVAAVASIFGKKYL